MSVCVCMCFYLQAACTLLCNSAPICMHKLMHVNNAVWTIPRQDKHEHDSVPMRFTQVQLVVTSIILYIMMLCCYYRTHSRHGKTMTS